MRKMTREGLIAGRVDQNKQVDASDSTRKGRIAEKLTPELAKRTWVAVPQILLETHNTKLGLSAEETMFLITVLSFKWYDDMPHPGLKKIAGWMGVDYSSVRRYAKKCRDLGVLKMIYRKGDTCEYDFTSLFGQLEEYAKEKEQLKKRARRRNEVPEVEN